MQKKNNHKDIHTFVICAYNESEYLEECIKSLISQTIKSNIIISTSTYNQHINVIAEKYNLNVVRHSEGGSIGKDWNNALETIETKYFTLVHQDDVYLPGYLSRILECMERNERCVIAFSNYCEIDEASRIKKRNKNLIIKDIMLKGINIGSNSKRLRKLVLSFGTPICCPAVTYNKEILKNFRFSEQYSAALDWEAFYRINNYGGSWNYEPSKLVWHRIHSQSETSRMIVDDKRTSEELEMFERFWPRRLAKILSNIYKLAQKTN